MKLKANAKVWVNGREGKFIRKEAGRRYALVELNGKETLVPEELVRTKQGGKRG